MLITHEEYMSVRHVVLHCGECPPHLDYGACAALVREAPSGLKCLADEWGWTDDYVREELLAWLNTEHGAWALRWVTGTW